MRATAERLFCYKAHLFLRYYVNLANCAQPLRKVALQHNRTASPCTRCWGQTCWRPPSCSRRTTSRSRRTPSRPRGPPSPAAAAAFADEAPRPCPPPSSSSTAPAASTVQEEARRTSPCAAIPRRPRRPRRPRCSRCHPCRGPDPAAEERGEEGHPQEGPRGRREGPAAEAGEGNFLMEVNMNLHVDYVNK